VPATEPPDEQFIALLCHHLPEMERSADDFGWAPQLQGFLIEFRNGTNITEASALSGLPLHLIANHAETTVVRGEPTDLERLGISRVDVTGRYACPAAHHPCPRRADADAFSGREPMCGLWSRPMIRRARS
jgi:hypothetical protein